MSGRSASDVRALGVLYSAGTGCGLSDVELLERFRSDSCDVAELAFEGLVLRHGPMVFDVCLKILGDTHDAQDAFQATFLILATKSRSIVRQEAVGSWLHGVALRVARRARAESARRKAQERRIAAMTSREIGPERPPDDRDFQVLHEEVERLPQKYREAIVYCYLESMTLESAAGLLRCPIGTVGVRLMRAREKLKTRLIRRGVARPDGLLVAGLASPPASTILARSLVASTVRVAIGINSGGVASLAVAKLTNDVLRSMVMIKLTRIVVGILVVSAAVASSGGFLVHSQILTAEEPAIQQLEPAAAFRVGQKVVTKYGARLRDRAQVVDNGRFLRIYTVDQIDGTRVRLAAEDISGWVESKDIVLFDHAIDYYGREIRRTPRNARAYHQRGLVWALMEEKEKAIADFTEAIRLEPKSADAYTDRGSAWYFQAEFDKAIADLNQAVQFEPRDSYAYYYRGLAWEAKDNFDKAIASFTETIRLDRQSGGAYYARGKCWLRKAEFDKAAADLTEAIHLWPEVCDIYFFRAQAWFEKKEYDKAIADLTEAIRLEPRIAFARELRADAWCAKKEYDKAIADYDQAIQLLPSSNAYAGRAWIWATCPDAKYRDGKKAVESATKSCELTEWNDASPIETLAAAYAELGDFDSAVKWQNKAAELYADAVDKRNSQSRLKLYQEKKPYRDAEP